MKRFLSFVLALLLPIAAIAQAPTPAPCNCKQAANIAMPGQDAVDMRMAVVAGFGERPAVGPLRKVTLAVRLHRDELMAGNVEPFKTTLGGVLAPNPQRACRIATFAVIGLQMANAFGAQIPPEVIAAAIAIQKQVCGTGEVTLAEPQTTTIPIPGVNSPRRAATTNWLSPQFILDGCAGSNGGCSGDDNTTVLTAAKNMGIPLESDYGPYVAYSQGCQTMSGSNVMLYTLSDWGYADPSTTGVAETSLIKAAILKYGCVGCAVAADGAFENYSGGVFSGQSSGINHDVYLFGWDDAKGAWLMANSWGEGWGVDPTSGLATRGPVLVKRTGLKLPPPNIRAAKHAAYRARNMRGIVDLVKLADNLPASYSSLDTEPPMENQQQCGSCWDFSGCRVASKANIIAGNLPKTSTPMKGGCMWIKYGSNEIGTEAVWGVAGTPVPYVAPPGPGPGPTPQPFSRRALNLYQWGIDKPDAAERMLRAAESAKAQYQNAQ